MPVTNKQSNSLVARTVIPPTTRTRMAVTRERTRRTPLPQWRTVVNVEVQCMGEGDIRVMIPDLLFKGLHNLMEEDRDACFLYPDTFMNQARKRADMVWLFFSQL